MALITSDKLPTRREINKVDAKRDERVARGLDDSQRGTENCF